MTQLRNEDLRIERVARALCEADGKDPDGKRQTGERETMPRGSGFAMAYKEISNWQDYEDAARKFIAAFDALKND